jgi:tetratricopeptide (TPR) repeat protein
MVPSRKWRASAKGRGLSCHALYDLMIQARSKPAEETPQYHAALATMLTALTFVLLTPAAWAGDSAPGALIKAGHWKRARTLVEGQYQVNPQDAEAAYLLSRVKLTFDDLDAALSLAEKAVGLDPKNSSYHYQLAVTCGRTAEKASLFSKAHWAKRFKEEAETATSLDPRNMEARFGLLEYYLQAPRLMGGGKDKARAMAEEIAKLDAVSGDLAEARVAEDNKDPTREHEAYGKAAAAGPKTYEDRISIANFFLRPSGSLGQSGSEPESGPPANPAAVEKLAREAAQLEPGRVDAYVALARLYAGQRRWKELDSTLGESEKRVPDNLTPYFGAGQVLLAQSPVGSKDLSRAERFLRKYLAQEPEGDSPSLAEAHWRLGLVLEKEGRKGEAASEVGAAIGMNPNLEKAKADLKRINGGS